MNNIHSYANSINQRARPPHRVQDDDADADANAPLYSISEEPVTSYVSHVYLNRGIGAPCEYTPLIHHLISRGQSDVVYMHFNCYGGRLDAGIEILTAMDRCRGTIVGCLDGVAYSMAALMFLRCHEFSVSRFSTLMLHTYSGGGIQGKAPDQRTASAATDRVFMSLVNTICAPFLTEREMKDMLDNGRDLYFSSEEVINRLSGEPKLKSKKKKKSKQNVAKRQSSTGSSEEELVLLLEDNKASTIDSNRATRDVS